MLNLILKSTLFPGILDGLSTGELPFIPSSSLRGRLRIDLTKLADNLIPIHSNNNLMFLLANSRSRLNKVLTSDDRKAIQLARFRWQFEKTNLRRDAIKSLTPLKDKGYQPLENQSYWFGWSEIDIRRLAGYLVLMKELLFRNFVIDNRCDFISLVDMPP